MQLKPENSERRKKRDPEILVWDPLVRIGHWLLALAFAALYLEYRKFPLHPYAGYLVTAVVVVRIVWGFVGRGAARFSAFRFGPRAMLAYLKQSLAGHAPYHFSHNPLGAAMVYALLASILANCLLGLLAYSASQQLGPLGALVPADWEDLLIPIHAWLGHGIAILVLFHLTGVVWAAWLHRENYVVAMLTGIRRIPRAVALPPGAVHPLHRRPAAGPWGQFLAWLTYRSPVMGSLVLMAAIVGLFVLPIVHFLVGINKVLPAY